ncbi:hypothetical protein MMC30_006496 [Trapelia coarctata]|nr:hypothetical protein [Trapelia coarctata]
MAALYLLQYELKKDRKFYQCSLEVYDGSECFVYGQGDGKGVQPIIYEYMLCEVKDDKAKELKRVLEEDFDSMERPGMNSAYVVLDKLHEAGIIDGEAAKKVDRLCTRFIQ